MKKYLLIFAALAGVAWVLIHALPTHAQAPVVTNPSGPIGTVDASGTIATTTTWQLVFSAGSAGISGQATRRDCLIQDVGANTEFIWYGAGNPPGGLGSGAAVTTSAFQLIPPATNVQGGSFGCATGGGNVIQDAIWITGTGGDGFVAKSE